MKNLGIALGLVISLNAFAGEGHATGGIADNRPITPLRAEEKPQKIIARKEFDTSKIDLTKATNPTDANQSGSFSKVPHTPPTEQPTGAVITNF